MRNVNISLTDTAVTYTDGKCVGVVGEHNATQLVIALPLSLYNDIDYNLLAFSDGHTRVYSEMITTDNTKSAYRSGSTLYCKLWQQLTQSTPIDVTVEAYKTGEDGNAVLVQKSPLIEGLYFELAASGIPEETDENAYGLGCDLEDIIHGHDNLETLDKLSSEGYYLKYNGGKLLTEWSRIMDRPYMIPGNGNRSVICNSIEYNKAENYYTATFGYNNFNGAAYCLTCGRFGAADSDDLFCVTNGRIGYYRSAAFHVKEDLVEAEVPIIAPTPPAGDDSTKLATTQWVNNEIDSLAAADHTHSEYAETDHTHDLRYYTRSDVDNMLSGKSGTDHTHSEYANADHNHDGRYYTQAEVDAMLAENASVSDPLTELAEAEVFLYSQISNVSAVYDSSAGITYYQAGAGGEYEPVTGLSDGDSVTGYWLHATQWYEYSPATNRKYKLTTPALAMDVANVVKFILPTPTDLTIDNSILIYMYTESEVTVFWGNDTMYSSGEIPTIESGKYYDLIFTYNPIAEKWCVGAVNQSAA